MEFWLSPWVLGLLGLCVGSFLNVVAHRLPRMLERRWGLDGAYQLSDAEGLQRLQGKPALVKALSDGATQWVRRWGMVASR